MKQFIFVVPMINGFLFLATIPCDAIAAGDTSKDADTYAISVAQGFEYDDNLFRLPSPALLPGQKSRSDTMSSTALSARADLKPNRQDFHVDATVISNNYVHNDFLNNTTASGDLAWNWQLGNYWSGTIGIDQRQQLPDYADLVTAERDVNTTRNGLLGLRYWLHPDWALELNSRRVTSRYEAAVSDSLEYDETWYEAGATFRRANGNEIEGVLQHVDGTYTHPTISSGYKQNSAVLRGDWAITEISDLEGYVEASRRKYSGVQSNDFSGWLWRTAYHWRPTVKLQFDAIARRELGSQLDLVDNRIITEGTGLSGSWKATEKIKTSYTYEWLHRDFVDLSAQNEVIRAQRIELLYLPKDYFDITFSIGREGRRTVATNRNYDVDISAITFRFKI
ncbi:MAG TPA: hypothetical protein VFW00_00115 [Rhodocyclaceae bacterium]|nr:hypothetical protein [Rhodocyclaceae bacterium]